MATPMIDDTVLQEALRLIGRAGEPWKRELVLASALRIDPAYQRTFSERWAAEIAARFDTFLAAGIKVSRRADGSLWVIDGQHRVRAWQMVRGDNALIPVDVIEGMTVEQEAFLFSQQNERRNLRSVQMHHARVAAGDERHLALEQLLAAHGLDSRLNEGTADNHRRFTGIGTLRAIAERGGLAHADETLRLVVAGLARPGMQVAAVHLDGMSALLLRFGPEIDRERLVRVLRECDVLQIRGQALGIKRLMNGTTGSSWGMVFHGLYNARLRTGRLPDWHAVTPTGAAVRARQHRLQDGGAQ